MKVYVGDIKNTTGLPLVKSRKLDKKSNYYMCLADVDHDTFLDVCNLSNELIYIHNNSWTSEELKTNTEMLLVTSNKNIHINEPDDKDIFLNLVDSRKTNNKQIWNLGCSITQGVGVSHDEKYGNLLSKKLGLEISYLTCGGSSIMWASDQLIRSDIKSGDIIIWGITNEYRIPFFNKGKLYHANFSSYEFDVKFPKKYISDRENALYLSLTAIERVKNFCYKCGCNLFLIDIIGSELWKYLNKEKNYIKIGGNMFIDLASDNMHPGPKTHEYIAERIYQLINSNNKI